MSTQLVRVGYQASFSKQLSSSQTSSIIKFKCLYITSIFFSGKKGRLTFGFMVRLNSRVNNYIFIAYKFIM